MFLDIIETELNAPQYVLHIIDKELDAPQHVLENY